MDRKKESIAAAETAYYEWDNVRQSETAVLEQLTGQKMARMMKEQNERELYLYALKNAGFDSEEDYERAVMDEAEVERLEAETAQREAQMIRRKERIRFLTQEVSHAEWQDMQLLKGKIEELSEQKKLKNERVSVLYNRMEINRNIKTRAEGLYRVRMQLQKEYSEVYTLSAVANGELSGKDRLPFEQYVQSFYFEQVIFEANHRLKQMSGGRYAIAS